MSYPVRVYGRTLNQSLSQYWSVLQMCITLCEHQITQDTVTHACPDKGFVFVYIYNFGWRNSGIEYTSK